VIDWPMVICYFQIYLVIATSAQMTKYIADEEIANSESITQSHMSN
jgi:hypothetical protein